MLRHSFYRFLLTSMLMGSLCWSDSSDECRNDLQHVIKRIENAATLGPLLQSKAVQKYIGHPATRPIVEGLRELRSVSIKTPFFFQATASEKGDRLRVEWLYIGSEGSRPRTQPQPTRLSWLQRYLQLFAGSGPNSRYQASPGYDPTFAMAWAAVIEGIDARMREQPHLETVEIEFPAVQNASLERLLVKRFGFQIIQPTRYVPGNVAGTTDIIGSKLRLEIHRAPKLPEP